MSAPEHGPVRLCYNTPIQAMEQLKAILVGHGRMGRNHFRVLGENPAIDLVGVLDPDPTLKSRLTRDVPVFPTIDALSAVDFDVAVIATPTATHFDTARALLEKGKHLLVEKPLTTSFKEGVQIIELARERGVRLAVGHVERFNPAVRKLREVLNEGFLGSPIHFNFTRVGGYPPNIVTDNNVVLDLAVHDIDILRSLVGPLRVDACMTHATVDPGVLDTAEIFLAGERGISATVHVNWITPTKIRTVRTTGTRGVCFVDYIMQTCHLMGGDLLRRPAEGSADFDQLQRLYQASDRIDFGVNKREPLVEQLEQFVRFVREGEPGELCLGADALSAVMLVERAIGLAADAPEPPGRRAAGVLPEADDTWV